MLEITTFILGPVQTNAYLIADTSSKEAVVIDPAWDGMQIVAEAKLRGWQIVDIWITHAHFDHLAGVAAIINATMPTPNVALHAKDLPLWKAQGGAQMFGIHIDPVPDPTISLSHNQIIGFGNYEMEVRHSPGHTPGHVIFSCPTEKIVFSGDVIFMQGIGRTDLPGGNYSELIHSISSQILTLADETRILTGHGPETTVGEERKSNPFLV